MTNFNWPEELQVLRNAERSRRVTVFGKLVFDQVVKLEKPLILEGNVTAAQDVVPGGAPANMTSELQRHGMRTRFSGWTGDDPASRAFVRHFKARGIEMAVTARGRSTTALLLSNPDGTRSTVTVPGHGQLTAGEVSPSWFRNSAVVHFDGYDLLDDSMPDAVLTAADMAHSSGALVSLDMCNANKIESYGSVEYFSLISRIKPHVLFANEHEAKVLGLAERHLSWKPLVLVHREHSPTVVLHGSRSFSVDVQPLKQPLVDSTGCGDAFAAGFLGSLANGEGSLSEAVLTAHSWAAEVALTVGGHIAVDKGLRRSLRDGSKESAGAQSLD